MLQKLTPEALYDKYPVTDDDIRKIKNTTFAEDYELTDEQIYFIAMQIRRYECNVEYQKTSRALKTKQSRFLNQGKSLLDKIFCWLEEGNESSYLQVGYFAQLKSDLQKTKADMIKEIDSLSDRYPSRTSTELALHWAVGLIMAKLRTTDMNYLPKNKRTLAESLHEAFLALNVHIEAKTFQNILIATTCPELQQPTNYKSPEK